MVLSLELLFSLNPNILDDIAFHLAVVPFLGPPTNLIPLLLTCRTLSNHLSINNNSSLYGRIFRFKFDCQAIERRLSASWASPPSLAQELRARFIALKHIKHGVPSPLRDRDALWRAYLMLLEDDGLNGKQLFGWANLSEWVLGVVALGSMGAGHSISDPKSISLALWLLWMTSSKESVTAEAPAVRTALTNAILPFLVRGYQYPSLFAPDTYFYLPLCEEHDNDDGFSGPLPLVAQIHYLGRKLKLAVPPPTPAAFLNFVVRQEAWQDTLPLPPRIARLPLTREEAIARNLESPTPTQEDVYEFHYRTRTRFFQQNQGLTSERLDKEWFRLVGCHTPSAAKRSLRGIVYPLGTIVGDWTGRILVPDLLAHLNAVVDPRIPATNVSFAQERISCTFEEHHCLSFSEPLVAPTRQDSPGEDIFTAWLPRDLQFVRRAGGLEIFDPSTGKNTWYETYHPGRRHPYSTGAHERLSGGLDREWFRDADTTMQGDDTGEVDEDEDFVEELPSGVQDIIITGETRERQGEAWGYHSYIGRIRPWDGLVVFLRAPMNNQQHDISRWIFKGYIHERSLVGRWRDTATDLHAVGFEGGFVLCQEDEGNTAFMT